MLAGPVLKKFFSTARRGGQRHGQELLVGRSAEAATAFRRVCSETSGPRTLLSHRIPTEAQTAKILMVWWDPSASTRRADHFLQSYCRICDRSPKRNCREN